MQLLVFSLLCVVAGCVDSGDVDPNDSDEPTMDQYAGKADGAGVVRDHITILSGASSFVTITPGTPFHWIKGRQSSGYTRLVLTDSVLGPPIVRPYVGSKGTRYVWTPSTAAIGIHKIQMEAHAPNGSIANPGFQDFIMLHVATPNNTNVEYGAACGGPAELQCRAPMGCFRSYYKFNRVPTASDDGICSF